MGPTAGDLREAVNTLKRHAQMRTAQVLFAKLEMAGSYALKAKILKIKLQDLLLGDF